LTDRPAKHTRRLNTRPSHDLADYAGDYEHPGYGRITITHAEGKLNWRIAYVRAARASHYDTFELPEAPNRLLPDRLTISFSIDREGDIASLAAPFEQLSRHRLHPHCGRHCTNPPPSALHRHVQPGITTVVVGQTMMDNSR